MTSADPTIAHIVAVAQNGTIGSSGQLPWNLPEDMKFFREKTRDHIVIMGRKTFDSIGKPLPHRLNIVVTRQTNYSVSGMTTATTIEQAISIAKKEANKWGNEIYICGGGEIYRQSIDFVDTIYLTRIHQDFAGEASYPQVDLTKFHQTANEHISSAIDFSFIVYKKSV